MKNHAPSAAALLLALGLADASAAAEVALCTDLGSLTLEVDERRAPRHAANFLEYVDQGYYSGTVFHRVIPGFMIQGGGYDRALIDKPARPPVRNESRNGLSNVRGTLAAARTADPHSAQAQFYINLADNAQLDASEEAFGYTVFGRVTGGMETADEIAALPTRAAGPFTSDVPQPLVGITSAARLDRDALAELPEQGREAAIRERIEAAIEAGDYPAALTWIGHYRATCAPMTPDMLLTEARTAAALLRTPRAQAALDEYFAEADEGDAGWQEALALYERVAPGTDPRVVTRRFGDCDAPDAPEIPDGAVVELDAMVAAQEAVRAYVSDGEGFLECLSQLIDAEDDAVSDADRAAAVQAHNRMVTSMENVAEAFNEEVRTFRERP